MNFFWLLFTLAASSPAQLEIELIARPPAKTGEVEISLRDPISGAESLRRTVEVPWRGTVEVGRPLDGLRLDLISPTFWSAPTLLADHDPAAILKVELFESCEILFSEEKGGAKEGPAAMAEPILLEVSSVPVPREKAALGKTRLDCSLKEERWHCRAPAMPLDLRLEKPGHAPRYVWNAKVEPGKTLDLGRIRFRRGSSISGFVTVAEGEPTGVRIEVEPAGSWMARDGQRRELRKLEALASERGFFQVLGISPGAYSIVASRSGLAEAELSPVDVREEQETSLAEPIHLDLAAVLEIHVSPPTGPLGRPWQLLLARERPGSNVADESFEGSTDEKGAFAWQGLRPGSFFLNVSNPDGEKTGAGDDSIWLSQFFELAPGNQTLYFDIPVIGVEGTFKAGDEPLQGRLIFGGYHGAPHVAIWTDEEGHFEGQLPRKGEWDLDAELQGQLLSLEKVNVEPRGGRAARLDIRLPDTRFHGRVTHKGKPVEGAELWGNLQEPGRSSRFTTKTNAEGVFDHRGIDPGRYEVTASSARLRLGAPQLSFEVREGADDPAVEIELEEFVRIEGQVLAGGEPAPMAAFRAVLKARQGEDSRQGQTDSTGVLRLTVPESTREIALVVAPAGFAWQIVALRPSLGTGLFAPFLVEASQNGGLLRVHGKDLVVAARLRFGGAEVPVYLARSALQSSGYFEEKGDQIVLANAAPGLYRVCRGNKCAEGVVTPGGTLDLWLDRQEGGEAIPAGNE
jgi:hypothetical protein